MSKVSADKENLRKSLREIFVEELRKDHSVRINIKGSCMHPFIRKTDIVTVKPIKLEETKVGDVVVYARNSHHGFTLHRLIKKRRDHEGREYLSTKGDANRHGDPAVYPEEIYGKVVTIERKDRTIIQLDTRYRHLQGYLLAKRSWIVGVLRILLKSPHLVPTKVICKIKRF